MKKSIILPLLSAFLCFGVALTSCQKGADNIIQSSDRNITSIAVKEGTLPDVIVLGHFDEAGIKVIVTYSDGTSEEVAVNSEFLGDEYADLIQTVGTHQISILYRGETINIIIKIVPVSYEICFYAREGENAEFSLVKTQVVGYLEDATAPDIQNEVWDDVKHYTFTNWDVDFTSVTKRLDVYAQYSSINYYTVNFYDWNEDVIKTQKVDQGSNATEPTEEERHLVGYEFIGWDRTYLNVTKNIDVYGIYQRATYSEVHYDLAPELVGNTIKYGLYPQSLVEDQTIIAALEQTEQHETGYYIYDEQFYKKVFVDNIEGDLLESTQYYFANTTYWFKVEPIEWNIVANEEGIYTLQSAYVLDAKQYFNTTSAYWINDQYIHVNNYSYSLAREFLINEFLNKAFLLNDSHLIKTLVNNSLASTGDEYNDYLCEDTNDKVWLQSANMVPSERKGLTDYCDCMHDFSGDNRYRNVDWTRTPDKSDSRGVRFAFATEVSSTGHWATDVHGIRPMIKIAL